MKFLKLLLLSGLAAATATHVVRRRRHLSPRGRLVLITGGSRGLGLAIAREFALKGARLVLLARDEEELTRARQLLSPAEVYTYVCDVTDTAQVDDVLSNIRYELGEISFLVNNAGAMTTGPESAMNAGDYQLAMDTNFHAPLHFIRTLVPFMKRIGEGRIINIASLGGLTPEPHGAPYAASKHALVGLSESLRTELVDFNIYITTVCPGFIDDGAPLHVLFKGRTDEEYAWFTKAVTSPSAANPVTLARKIVAAASQGEPMLIYPFSAYCMAAFHNLFPGLSTEIATLLERRLLPADDRNDGPTRGSRLASADPAQAESFARANAQGVSSGS